MSAASERWLPRAIQLIARTLRFLERGAGPVADLVIRLGLAQVFFVSAVLKLANWDNALYLAAYEYPVSWMDPVTAAYLGVTVEFLGAVLLASGLATRAAAFALGALALVIQFNYSALDVHLFWTALAAWYVVRGAGPLSLDRLIAPGLADSAIPLAARAVALGAALTRHGTPWLQLALRLWLAAALVGGFGGEATQFIPLRSAQGFGSWTALALPLALGLATRPAALLLIACAGGLVMVGGGPGDIGYWSAVLALLALHGAGRYSIDALIASALGRRFPQLEGKPAFSLDGVPRVVIVGAGFGGLACAARLADARAAVTLLDRHNYHLFQPLLYQVATTALSPADIATPIRGLFREHFNIRVLLGEVTGVDRARQEVLADGNRIPYDYLVLATGAAHSYFGRDEWGVFAPGLKRVEDATEVRRRLLSAFERAEACHDAREREALLTFLIVGGGPTGVELAGAIAELARFGMEKEFRTFDPASARILLVQAGERLLPTFPEALSAETRRSLEKLGVEVLLNSRVEAIDDAGVMVSGTRIPARTVLWAAGVVASPAARWLGAEADNAGRVKVGADLSVPALPNVFVVGDTAACNAWNGRPVPGLAPAAKQAGQYVAKLIRARMEGQPAPEPFVYRHLGSLATIGRKSAVVDFGGLRLSGAPAWWLWGAVHIGFLIGLRNRMSVMLDWFWAYLTFRSGVRLITGGEPRAGGEASAAAPRSPWPSAA
ncbi:MAG TPA: FAD-dependent oxidoreductase [Burkholderiales bacterium]|nr:FAD-dependent oxidoreductase [Burkholderiales bacterium]